MTWNIDKVINWPRIEGRLVCAPEHPRPDGSCGRWVHADALDIGTCGAGCCDRYRCRWCGAEWTGKNYGEHA